MLPTELTTAADCRAAIARLQIPLYKVAAQVDVHPATLSKVLHEHVPLTRDLAARIRIALEKGRG